MVILGRYSEYVYAIFRIVFGFLIMLHGTQKIFGIPEAKMQAMGLPYYAGYIELICGLLILLAVLMTVSPYQGLMKYYAQHGVQITPVHILLMKF